jgi:hypothetical protein
LAKGYTQTDGHTDGKGSFLIRHYRWMILVPQLLAIFNHA